MFKHLLVPVDASELSIANVGEAVRLACSLTSAASRPVALAVSMARSFSSRAGEWQYSSTSPSSSALGTRCSLIVTSPADCTSVAWLGSN